MLKYKLYKDTRSNSQFKGCWYARIAKSDIITTRQLVAHMAKHGTAYSKGTMWAVITDMITCVHELILRGQAVKIDDLAIFTCGIVNKEGAADKAKFSVAANIESIKLRARATGELTRANLNREASLMDIEKLANLSGAGTENGTPGDTPGGGTTDPGDKKDEENKNPGGTGSEGTGSEGTGSEGTGSEGSGSDSGHVNL